MIYRQLLTITYQNENYILIKLEHPSLSGEGCSNAYFFANFNLHNRTLSVSNEHFL